MTNTCNGILSPNKRMILTVIHVIGMLLVMESVFMAVCILPGIISKQYFSVRIMAESSIITAFAGLLMWIPLRTQSIVIDKRDSFLIVTLIWVIFSLFGCLPYTLGGYITDFADAYFETVSGFSTCGATILYDVESLPYSVGLWRILTHWIGGIGIIVIVLSVIPFVGGGGTALFSAEMAGTEKNKIAPRIKETSNVLIKVYIGLTVFYFAVYLINGMGVYDAVGHAFSTIATGGFSTKNDSLGAFSPKLQYISVIFMLLSGTNLLLVYSALKLKFRPIVHSEEFRVYYLLVIISTAAIFLINSSFTTDSEENLRNALFTVSSLITSTGFVNCDYGFWPTSSIFIIVMLMIFGAMSGSTTGGLKITRMILLFKNVKNAANQGLHSNAFMPVTLDKKMVTEQTLFAVFNIFILYIISMVIGTLILVATGVTLDEAIVSSISALSNMGPAYGKSCSGNFAHFTPFAKMTMSFMMIAGRLELVTVYSIFTKWFWKR